MKDLFEQGLLQKGFKHSDYKDFELDQNKLSDSGFKFSQIAMLEGNISCLNQIPLKNRKFYIVKLSKKINDVRFWGSY